MIEFYELPDCFIAQNHKAASSSLAAAICAAYYPILLEQTNGMPMMCRFIAPRVAQPNKLVRMLVRDPVERFQSACARLNMSIDAALDDMNDVHFTPQIEYTKHGQETVYYRFPDGLEKLCEDAGLDNPPHLNTHTREKPVPTTEQLARIEVYYAQDLELFGRL